MRTAIVSDVHSNLPALEAVLKRINELKVDNIYCLGDIVGYGPFPNECTELIRKSCPAVVQGNHDSGVTGGTTIDDFNVYGQAAIQWTQKQITPKNLEYLRNLPLTRVEGDLTLVHSSPVKPEEWTYILSLSEAIKCFTAFQTELCFIGHTHIPAVVGEDMTVNAYKRGVRQLINVGSVGQPRDGNPDSAFGLLDTAQKSYTLVRVPYDTTITIRAIKDAGLPSFLGKRLQKGV